MFSPPWTSSPSAWSASRTVRGCSKHPRSRRAGVESADVLAAIMRVDPVPQVEEARWLSRYRAFIEDGKEDTAEAPALRARLLDHFGAHHPVMIDCDESASVPGLQAPTNRAPGQEGAHEEARSPTASQCLHAWLGTIPERRYMGRHAGRTSPRSAHRCACSRARRCAYCEGDWTCSDSTSSTIGERPSFLTSRSRGQTSTGPATRPTLAVTTRTTAPARTTPMS